MRKTVPKSCWAGLQGEGPGQHSMSTSGRNKPVAASAGVKARTAGMVVREVELATPEPFKYLNTQRPIHPPMKTWATKHCPLLLGSGENWWLVARKSYQSSQTISSSSAYTIFVPSRSALCFTFYPYCLTWTSFLMFLFLLSILPLTSLSLQCPSLPLCLHMLYFFITDLFHHYSLQEKNPKP